MRIKYIILKLLLLKYAPIAALNRSYALSKVNGKLKAIPGTEKLNLVTNHLYYSLLGYLYTGIDDINAVEHFKTGLKLAKSTSIRQC